MVNKGTGRGNVEGLLNGIYENDSATVNHEDQMSRMFYEKFEDQLEANKSNDEAGSWLDGVVSDYDFRNKVLNTALYEWDSVLTGVENTPEQMSVYDEVISDTFSSNGNPMGSSAVNREQFMKNYVTLLKSPIEYNDNPIDRDHALAEVKGAFSDEVFFEENFGDKETYTSLLTHRRRAELAKMEDLRDNVYSKDLAKDASRSMADYTKGSSNDTVEYQRSKMSATLVFSELEDLEINTYDERELGDIREEDSKYAELMNNLKEYHESVSEESEYINNKFIVESQGLLSKSSVKDLDENDFSIPNWNGFIPATKDGDYADGFSLYSRPLPPEDSPVTVEMTIGEQVNKAAERLQSKDDQLSNMWSVKDFVDFKEQANVLLSRDLDPYELTERALPISLNAHDVSDARIIDSCKMDIDTLYGSVDLIDSEAERHYMTKALDSRDLTLLHGGKEDIIALYGESTWSKSEFSENYSEPESAYNRDAMSKPSPEDDFESRSSWARQRFVFDDLRRDDVGSEPAHSREDDSNVPFSRYADPMDKPDVESDDLEDDGPEL